MSDNYSVTKDILLKADVPQQTSTYKPVSHQQLIDITLESIYQAGFQLDHETYSSALDGKIANGRYTIKDVADSEMQLQIGWQNSYNKSLSLKFAVGTRILVCSNGCVSGDFGAFKKKHVGTVQEFAPQAITEYIKRAGDMFSLLQRDRETMKQASLDKRTISELVGRMFIEEEFIQSTQLNIIKKELEAPTHDYGAPGSVWELYNFTTYAMKELHPSLWMEKHMKAHTFFNSVTGIPSRNVEIAVPIIDGPTQLSLEF